MTEHQEQLVRDCRRKGASPELIAMLLVVSDLHEPGANTDFSAVKDRFEIRMQDINETLYGKRTNG